MFIHSVIRGVPQVSALRTSVGRPNLGRMKRKQSLTPRALPAKTGLADPGGMSKSRHHPKQVLFSSPQERAAYITGAEVAIDGGAAL